MVYRELPIRFDYLCITCRRSLGLDLHLSIRPLPILRSFPPKHFPYPINTEKWKQGYLSCRPSAYIVCLATVLDTVTARERRQKPVYSIACLRSPHEQGQAHRDIRGLAGIIRRGDRLPGRGRAYFGPMTMITSGGERVAAGLRRECTPLAITCSFPRLIFPGPQGAVGTRSYIVHATISTLLSIPRRYLIFNTD